MYSVRIESDVVFEKLGPAGYLSSMFAVVARLALGAPGCRRGTASKVTEALGLLGVSDVGDLF